MIDHKCSCGWDLPFSVMPYRASISTEDTKESDVLPGIMVGLVCPTCKEGHVFYSPDVARDLKIFGLGSGGKPS